MCYLAEAASIIRYCCSHPCITVCAAEDILHGFFRQDRFRP